MRDHIADGTPQVGLLPAVDAVDADAMRRTLRRPRIRFSDDHEEKLEKILQICHRNDELLQICHAHARVNQRNGGSCGWTRVPLTSSKGKVS